MNRNIFNSIKVYRPNSNRFDLSHDVKMTGKFGNLMPVNIQECVPGDRWDIGCQVYLRFMPMVSPVMHRYNVYTHTFFVPSRLVWDNWEEFITDKPTGGLPYILADDTLTDEQTLFLDYCGIPPHDAPGMGYIQAEPINAIPLAGLNHIYNEYYRDQNIIADDKIMLVDGNNAAIRNQLTLMRQRAYAHDYLTSALPEAQAGSAVDIPLGDVILKPNWFGVATQRPFFVDENGTIGDGEVTNVSTGNIIINNPNPPAANAYDPDGTLQTEATTINAFRTAEKLQMVLEKFMRGGTRYTEMLQNFFAVTPQDARLQRPEYITGSMTPVTISEVLNQTSIDGELPQGNMAGHGVAIGASYKGTYHVKEHGYMITIMSILPLAVYAQGINRMWLRQDWTDFYFPEFAHLGEQAILKSEVYAYQADGRDPDDPFGYTSRYAELKYQPSRIAAGMRDFYASWHSARIFNAAPTLSAAFVQCDPDSDENTRIFASQAGDDYFVINVVNKQEVDRLMPVYGTPML